MKKILIAFATGDRWTRSIQSLFSTAQLGGFDGVIEYNDFTVKDKIIEVYSDIPSRGYGYWQWKSIILLDAMSKVDEGDIVAYIDSGNNIIHPLEYVFDKCNENGIVLFDNRDSHPTGDTHKNIEWTKRDCFVLMDCDTEMYHRAPQVDAAYQFYKKTPKVMEFLEEYAKYSKDKRVISDLPNTTGNNYPEFRDHRHDQSILSLLAVKHNIELLPEPSEFGNRVNKPYPQLFWHHRGAF